MKKLFTLSILALTLFCSCEKKSNEPETNVIDKYVGTYRITCNKEIKIYDCDNQKYLTSWYVDYNAVEFMFEKTKNGELLCSLPAEYNPPLGAFEADGKLYFKDGENTLGSDHFVYRFVAKHDPATLSGHVLKWTTRLYIEITGIGSMSGKRAEGGDYVENTAILMD